MMMSLDAKGGGMYLIFSVIFIVIVTVKERSNRRGFCLGSGLFGSYNSD